MIRFLGVKMIDNKQVSSIDLSFKTHDEYLAKKDRYINDYPDYTWNIVEMDDLSFLQFIHVECEANQGVMH